eukprot:2505130-Pleurochrysis_carterae.AAC.1
MAELARYLARSNTSTPTLAGASPPHARLPSGALRQARAFSASAHKLGSCERMARHSSSDCSTYMNCARRE